MNMLKAAMAAAIAATMVSLSLPSHAAHDVTARPTPFASPASRAFTALQEQVPGRRDVALVAREYRFIPDRIEVTQDDLVRVTFTSEGRAATFAVDAYRILKRAGPDQTIVFEFRADQAGTFTFYCSLTSDPKCRDMKGTLVVNPK